MSTIAEPDAYTQKRPSGRGILVCLDLTPVSECCVPLAVSLARTFGNAITLLHVMQQQEQHGSAASDPLSWEISRQEATRYLERIEQAMSKTLGSPVSIRLEQGRPEERIVDLARELDAEFTVLGRCRKGSSPSSLPGRTIQHVLASGSTSVLVAESVSTSSRAAVPERILVPLDGSPRTESVIPAAVRIAKASKSELLLVHVVQAPSPNALLADPEDMKLAEALAGRLETQAQRYLDDLRRPLAHELRSVRTLVAREKNPMQRLLEIVQREKIDLVVLSAHGATCDSVCAFGNVTGYLLTHAIVPLLVLQDLAERALHRTNDISSTMPPPLRANYALESA